MWGTLIRLRTRNSISMEENTRTNVFERYFFDFKLMPLSFLPRDPMKIRQIRSSYFIINQKTQSFIKKYSFQKYNSRLKWRKINIT